MNVLEEELKSYEVRMRELLIDVYRAGQASRGDTSAEIQPPTLKDAIGIAPYDDFRAFGVDMGEDKAVHRGWLYLGKNPMCNHARLNDRNIIRYVANYIFDIHGVQIRILEGSTPNRFGCQGHDSEGGLSHSNLQAVDFEYIWDATGKFWVQANYKFFSTLHKYIPTMTARMWGKYKKELEAYANARLDWIIGDANPTKYNHDTHAHCKMNTKSKEDYAWEKEILK